MDSQTAFKQLKQSLQSRIVGQPELIESLMLSLLADSHLLVEGAPGLAKTTAIKALAEAIQGEFKRIQFTPDLMPADVTGSEIYRVEEQRFEFQSGPIFANLVLADEINRAPAKVQSALLEAMSEKQVSSGGTTYTLPEPFLVMATQNPIENEGTYPLPEAQLDRFNMKVNLTYPTVEQELAILSLMDSNLQAQQAEMNRIDLAAVYQAKQDILDVYVSDAVKHYVVHLINATRQPERYHPSLEGTIAYGASPRASIALLQLGRALAWLEGQSFVSPEHIQRLANRVLAHRILPTLFAQAEGISSQTLVSSLLEHVAVG